MTDSNDRIRAKIDAFIREIDTLTRAAALEAVRAALGEGAASSAPTRAARRPAPRAMKPQKSAASSASRSGGGKRTPEAVQAVADKVLAYVKAHAGERLEEIGRGMKVDTHGLKLPIQKLLAERKLKTKGQKRGTKYFAGGAAPKSAAKAVAKAVAKRTAPKVAKKRKPMSPEQKKALLERLAQARAARAAKHAAAK